MTLHISYLGNTLDDHMSVGRNWGRGGGCSHRPACRIPGRRLTLPRDDAPPTPRPQPADPTFPAATADPVPGRKVFKLAASPKAAASSKRKSTGVIASAANRHAAEAARTPSAGKQDKIIRSRMGIENFAPRTRQTTVEGHTITVPPSSLLTGLVTGRGPLLVAFYFAESPRPLGLGG